MNCTNLPEDEKSEKLSSAEEHLTTAKEERNAYNDKKEKARLIGKTYFVNITMAKEVPMATNLFPCSIAFYYAQLVHNPSNPLLILSCIFLNCTKCEIFGICLEGSRF